MRSSSQSKPGGPAGEFFDSREFAPEGSPAWTQEIFARAFCTGARAPFPRVCGLLRAGFSVLCYVPGSCMEAASRYAQKKVFPGQWAEFGRHPGPGGSMDKAWGDMGGIVGLFGKWLDGGNRPNAVFMNLDRVFHDNNNGVVQSPAAQLALFSMIESARRVPTLGLADRDFGRLPDAVEAAFAERVWLQEIDADAFRGLIPVELARRVAPDGRPADGDAWLLASRLRWTDPVRAVMLMRAVASDEALADAPAEEPQEGLAGVLDRIWRATRPLQFTDPEAAFPGDPRKLTGVPEDVVQLLRGAVVTPYDRWRRLAGRRQADYERELRMLPPGVIFWGPPGTGKTYLAQWIAKSVGLPIRVVAGAELRDTRYGVTERNIVRLFHEARRAAPCVLVLDDADDLLVDRSQATGSTASADRAAVNTVLQALSGFGGRIPGVLVILTTNRFHDLDAAVRSRIPLHVHVPYPLAEEQVRQVVEAVAAEYEFDLDERAAERLTRRFMQPVIQAGGQGAGSPLARRQRHEGLFSPRDIHQTMAMLRGGGTPGDRYRVTDADIDRLERYFADLAQNPPPRQ